VANAALVGLQRLEIDQLQLVGTTAEQSQAEYIYLGALVVAMGGVVFWAPKLFGRVLPDKAAAGLALLTLLGTVAVALPNLLLGLVEEQPAFATGGYPDGDLTALNAVSAVGWAAWALVLLAFAGLLLRAARGADARSSDPWHGHTLEWSPTPHIGRIRSDRPLLDPVEASS
jgi:heme/copper-type cytochrome/quinol oxidase subunit 1